MSDYAHLLKDFKPEKDFLVAIDSDGCVFDAMGIKQRECFCPMLIAHFGLQPVALAARECKEFADLFSKTRGANRHKTVARILSELLPNHPMVKALGFNVPSFKYYIEWVNNPESLLSNEGLQQAIDNACCPEAKSELEQAMIYSVRVNEMVSEVVKNVPAFPFVKESLAKTVTRADIIVCSSTPTEALKREWTEHGVVKYTKAIAGQEMGSKAEHLAIMREKYPKDKILMVGDAPGDQKAAEANDVVFYPINPGAEDKSWKRFLEEAFDKFITGQYRPGYERVVKVEFDNCLPTNPSW